MESGLLFVDRTAIMKWIITVKAGITMTPEEFDINFDFDKEYSSDPNPNKSSFDDDFDLDAALERELGPDFDRLFEEEYAESQAKLNAQRQSIQDTICIPSVEEESAAEEDTEEEDQPEDEFAAFNVADFEPSVDDQDDDNEDFSAVFAAVTAARDSAAHQEAPPAPEPEIPQEKEPTAPADLLKKFDFAAIGAGFVAVGKVLADNFRLCGAALKEWKPGKMDRKAKRRFKNDALPVIMGCAAGLICLVFIIGSMSRGFNSEDRKQAALEASIAQAEAEAAAAREIENILSTAARQAAGYHYQAALNTLDSYRTEDRDLTPEMAAARIQYAEAINTLVVWDDPAAIPNLSFHVLIADPDRAYSDPLASSYKSNFVTTDQFSAILEKLYEGGYVLVNLDSCLTTSTGADGKATCTVQPVYLPEGKKPIMITETLVNYFAYMVDGNNDGTPDADGAGFASRLVVRNGRVVAEYIDSQGTSLVGNYDLVPILDSFIDAHPDFSYQGAKAILAVTGDEGVFGWRTNTGDSAAIADAKKVVETLRSSGYQIACNSFDNLDYGTTSMDQISGDLNSWKTHVVPVLGEVDILVVARGGEMAPGSTRFQKVYDAGFRYILDAGTSGTKLENGFFYQNRIMVVGSKLQSGSYSTYFKLS